MLEDENAGILINPLKAGEIVAQVKRLFTDPSLITEFGEKARKAVLKKYNEQIIGEIIEEAFKSMISLKK
jgi:glycosyltransferase involved in cell wall biosynthesis